MTDRSEIRDGVNAALPFSYKDVAHQIAENAWRLDRDGWRRWYPIIIYYSPDKGVFVAEPGAPVDSHAVRLYDFKPEQDRNLPGRDYSTRYADGYDDYDDDDDRYGALYNFEEDLMAALAYARGVIEPYLMKKMERENLAAKWVALIEEGSKNE